MNINRMLFLTLMPLTIVAKQDLLSPKASIQVKAVPKPLDPESLKKAQIESDARYARNLQEMFDHQLAKEMEAFEHAVVAARAKINKPQSDERTIVQKFFGKFPFYKKITAPVYVEFDADLQEALDVSKALHESSKPSKPAASGTSGGSHARHTPIQLKANQQSGQTCGFHSLINAGTLEDIVRSGEPISSENLQRKAQQWADIIYSQDQLSMEKMQPIIDMLQLNDKAYFLYRNQRTGAIQSADAGVRECFSQLSHASTAKRAYFICNTSDNWERGGHWFVVAVIKQAHARPQIIVMDSMNWDWKNRDASSAYPMAPLVNYICDSVA